MCDLLSSSLSQGTVITPDLAQSARRNRRHSALDPAVAIRAERDALPRLFKHCFEGLRVALVRQAERLGLAIYVVKLQRS
jgi:hypothetical protein